MLYNVWNKVYVKKIIVDNNIKFPKYNWGEDIDFNKNYLNHINSMYNSDNCFYHYVRERSGAVTKKYNTNLFEIRLKEYNEFNDYFESWGIPENKYLEFSSRRYIERVLGCIENIYCSNLNFREKYKIVKKIINNPVTRLCVKNIKPTSKKIKIMIIPIKLRLVLLTMALGKISNIVKNKFPGLFNKLKNRR